MHHRKSPILTAALMAKYPSCEIGAYYAIMRSARILDDLERIGVPGVVGAYAHPAAASGWGIVVVSMQQQYAGHAAQVLALDRAMPGRGLLHQMDHRGGRRRRSDRLERGDVGAVDALPSVGGHRHPEEDLVDRPRSEPVRDGAPALWSKALIDACKPHRHLKSFPATTLLRREVYERVAARWAELGFTDPPPTADEFPQGLSEDSLSFRGAPKARARNPEPRSGVLLGFRARRHAPPGMTVWGPLSPQRVAAFVESPRKSRNLSPLGHSHLSSVPPRSSRASS